MKSYLKHNHYLLLGSFIILCAQLMWELLYSNNPITFTNNEGETIFELSIWLILSGFSLYNLIVGWIYWKVRQYKKLSFQLKYLHINLSIIIMFFILFVNNINSFSEEQLVITTYFSFPFIHFNSTQINVLSSFFAISQLIFIFHMIGSFIFTHKKQLKSMEDFDHLILK